MSACACAAHHPSHCLVCLILLPDYGSEMPRQQGKRKEKRRAGKRSAEKYGEVQE